MLLIMSSIRFRSVLVISVLTQSLCISFVSVSVSIWISTPCYTYSLYLSVHVFSI
ncbi:hypothetical protein HanHA300_Chr14g0508501 [Helianthus annuus]|nr:hypothetical protein HanHA300_Chr14g0508501 [Helianthus annuus]KAJ0484177.1 hypothetical protein HanHA89_Chr14g0541211 [Helianthus annuus]